MRPWPVVVVAIIAEVLDLPNTLGQFPQTRHPAAWHLGTVRFVLGGCFVCRFELAFGCCTYFDTVVGTVVVACIDFVVEGIDLGYNIPTRSYRSSGVFDYKFETSCFCWTLVC